MVTIMCAQTAQTSMFTGSISSHHHARRINRTVRELIERTRFGPAAVAQRTLYFKVADIVLALPTQLWAASC